MTACTAQPTCHSDGTYRSTFLRLIGTQNAYIPVANAVKFFRRRMTIEPKLLPEVKSTTKFLVAQISTGLVLSQHTVLRSAENLLARNMDRYYEGYEVIPVRRWNKHFQERSTLHNPVSAEERLLRFQMRVAELIELRKQTS